MRGSWSIKAVLPTIAPELSYDNLAVSGGDDVQTVYLQAIRAETSDTEREVLRKNLLDYCERDTLAMVRLACWRCYGWHAGGAVKSRREATRLTCSDTIISHIANAVALTMARS